MPLTRLEIAAKLKRAGDAVEKIGALLGSERAQSACQEAAAILHEAAREFTPGPPPKYPNLARENARRVAMQAKPAGVNSE